MGEMETVEITLEALGFSFELHIPAGFVPTGAAILLKGQNVHGELIIAGDTEGLNYLERLGLYTYALEAERGHA